MGEAKLLSSILFTNNKDLQNRRVIVRHFMYKYSHPSKRPALPRDFLHYQKSSISYWLSKLDTNRG